MFSPALNWWPPNSWPDNSPESLLDSCLSILIENPSAMLDYDEAADRYSLKPGVTLPWNISERLLALWGENNMIQERFLHVFRNTEQTKLKRLNLAQTCVSDTALEWLMAHKPREVNIYQCKEVTIAALGIIQQHSDNLAMLFFGNNPQILNLCVTDAWMCSSAACNNCALNSLYGCSRLQVLSIHGLHKYETIHHANFIKQMPVDMKSRLVYLDLSKSEIDISGIGSFPNLTTLILYDVPIMFPEIIFPEIGKLKTLRVLDLSQSGDAPVLYKEPEALLKQLVDSLPHLTHLDISGTNLAGFPKPKQIAHSLKASDRLCDEEDECAVPGLEGHFLEFLGLLSCAHNACDRKNIPAKHVTGNADEPQTILSVQKYVHKPDLLLHSLDHLFQLCRQSECHDQRTALKAILEAMKKHPKLRAVQISGSASLFYICKSGDKDYFSVKVKRVIIRTLLEAMENHMGDKTMLRNGCLTLCHFKIPQDLMFDYERVVKLLLKIVRPDDQPNFHQHVGIYLLNSLACQVNGPEKQLVGDVGAIKGMLELIEDRLRRGVCDEVMEIAWSTMWNVTDETALNCERFIEGDGLNLFVRCLKMFPNKEELLRNMMGLMGNVAEVPYLRPKLMRSEYVTIFSNLLDSSSDGIEVSYNACGVLAHMVSDGDSAWVGDVPPRRTVLQRMVNAISRWKINTKRNINYRSFEPILRLLPKFHTPEAQHWAVWALCNLTRVYRKKYCDLVLKENGLQLLEQLVADPRPFPETKELASHVIRRCKMYQDNEDYESSDETDVENMEEDDE